MSSASSSTFKCILALTDAATTIVNCKYVEDMSQPYVYNDIISLSKSKILPAKYQIVRVQTNGTSGNSQKDRSQLNENIATFEKFRWDIWRTNLFDGITFILLNKPDQNMNYATLLKNCGGKVLHCYDNICNFPSLNDVENIKTMVYVMPPRTNLSENLTKTNGYLKEINKFNQVPFW